jgi:hypothetical protein
VAFRMLAATRQIFDHSWLNRATPRPEHTSLTARQVLDKAVRGRQGELRRRHFGAPHEFFAPYSVEGLVRTLRRTLEQLEHGVPYREPIHLSIACALIGELCGSALCPTGNAAGHIYPKPGKHDEDWERVHGPLYILRNALFHPGAVVPRDNKVSAITPHVQALCECAKRDGASRYGRRLADRLSHASDLTDELVAVWAVEKVAAMGDYELNRLELRY